MDLAGVSVRMALMMLMGIVSLAVGAGLLLRRTRQRASVPEVSPVSLETPMGDPLKTPAVQSTRGCCRFSMPSARVIAAGGALVIGLLGLMTSGVLSPRPSASPVPVHTVDVLTLRGALSDASRETSLFASPQFVEERRSYLELPAIRDTDSQPWMHVAAVAGVILMLAYGWHWLRWNLLGLVPAIIAAGLIAALFGFSQSQVSTGPRVVSGVEVRSPVRPVNVAPPRVPSIPEFPAETPARPDDAPTVPVAVSEGAAVVEPVDAPPVTVFQGIAAVGETATELPSWTEESDVLRSSPGATILEAESDLLEPLRIWLAEAARASEPAVVDWRPALTLALLDEVVVQRAVERSEITVGEFTEPVYRAYWKLEVTPEFTSRLLGLWRADLVETRLLELGGVFAGTTAILGLLAGYLRYRRRGGPPANALARRTKAVGPSVV